MAGQDAYIYHDLDDSHGGRVLGVRGWVIAVIVGMSARELFSGDFVVPGRARVHVTNRRVQFCGQAQYAKLQPLTTG